MARWIVDPGHGWLEVTIPQVIKAMEAGFIPSDYSYMTKTNAFLEEDVDAGRFLWAMGWEDKEFRTKHINRFDRTRQRLPDSPEAVEDMLDFFQARNDLKQGDMVRVSTNEYEILYKYSTTSYAVRAMSDGEIYRLPIKHIDEIL